MKIGDLVTVARPGGHNLRIGASGRVVRIDPDGMIALRVGNGTAWVPRRALTRSPPKRSFSPENKGRSRDPKRSSTWQVSLQVTSPSRRNLRHQLQYTVQASNREEAVEKAKALSRRDGNTVIGVVSAHRGLRDANRDPAKRRSSRPKKPRVGDRTTVRGVPVEIVKVHPFGTIDVVSLDGKHAWRVTGLSF
jgi:1,2-phenylacetyl-CoA epoxidase PaaB subunit